MRFIKGRADLCVTFATMLAMLGEKIREARVAQRRSLADIASKAKVSVATLSRIENDKQSLDVELFMKLAKLLHINPQHLIGGDGNGSEDGVDPLSRRIVALGPDERAELWRTLAAERRSSRNRRLSHASLGEQVEELLAQIEFIREELTAVRARVRNGR